MQRVQGLQLKNQIAALYSLRAKGTKAFEIDDTPLGWKAIEDQYHRDKARRQQDCVPKVPNLKYKNVYRDVWTRLNVLPAKIMPVKVFCVRNQIIMFNSWKIESTAVPLTQIWTEGIGKLNLLQVDPGNMSLLYLLLLLSAKVHDKRLKRLFWISTYATWCHLR